MFKLLSIFGQYNNRTVTNDSKPAYHYEITFLQLHPSTGTTKSQDVCAAGWHLPKCPTKGVPFSAPTIGYVGPHVTPSQLAHHFLLLLPLSYICMIGGIWAYFQGHKIDLTIEFSVITGLQLCGKVIYVSYNK